MESHRAHSAVRSPPSAAGDGALAKAILQAEAGLIAADLGGGLIKLRLAEDVAEGWLQEVDYADEH